MNCLKSRCVPSAAQLRDVLCSVFPRDLRYSYGLCKPFRHAKGHRHCKTSLAGVIELGRGAATQEAAKLLLVEEDFCHPVLSGDRRSSAVGVRHRRPLAFVLRALQRVRGTSEAESEPFIGLNEGMNGDNNINYIKEA